MSKERVRKYINDMSEILFLKLENEGIYITKPHARALFCYLAHTYAGDDKLTMRYGTLKNMILTVRSDKLYDICKEIELKGYKKI